MGVVFSVPSKSSNSMIQHSLSESLADYPNCSLISSLKLTFAPENGWLEYFLVSFWDGPFSGAIPYGFR